MVVALIDLLKILTTWEYFFFSIVFIIIKIFISILAILRANKDEIIGGLERKYSLTDSYLLKQAFFEVVYFFSFFIH